MFRNVIWHPSWLKSIQFIILKLFFIKASVSHFYNSNMIVINQVICCVGVRIVLIISINELVIFLFLALKVLSYVLQWAWLVIHKLNKCVYCCETVNEAS